MTDEEIHRLMSFGKFPASCPSPELIETHISWVIICNDFVFKCKKPIKYDFLDFSDLEKRLYFCQRELELNKRLAPEIYLEVLPIFKTGNMLGIGQGPGQIIDYCLKMIRMDENMRMDRRLLKNNVHRSEIDQLAAKLAHFHHNSSAIYEQNSSNLKSKFNDLLSVHSFLEKMDCSDLLSDIESAISMSNSFLRKNVNLISSRIQNGFVRDCHGDLHSRNVFLYPTPVIFDCIEFNDELRTIDILNEVAFLCMDLDAFRQTELSQYFLKCYLEKMKISLTPEEYRLFIYFKAYRANVRAKVNALRSMEIPNIDSAHPVFKEILKYSNMMMQYLHEIS